MASEGGSASAARASPPKPATVAPRSMDRRPPASDRKLLRRSDDRWLERWLSTTADLARLSYSHPMVDAVVDEIDGRWIRIGEHWLADFASCNYLGLDLDRSVIDAIPAYLDHWGTHPSWSRLLGS